MERIEARNVSKKFNIGFRKNQGVMGRVLSFFSGKENKKEIWAVKDVSFKINPGEIVAIIGINGSGKSTLLRLIAGILRSDTGSIQTTGRIISLISLTARLQERLSLKDNIYLYCSIFGLDQKTIKKQFKPIVKFASLEDFINTKVYQFSDGMKLRLAFSIAIHSNPEILLLDEVFAVGDLGFQRKGMAVLKKLVKKKVSIILTTHYLELFEKLLGKTCDKVIWMDHGKIIKSGASRKILSEYNRKT